MPKPIDKVSLRQQLRAQRRALTPQQQIMAAERLQRRAAHLPLFIRARRIAFYLPADGEISPEPLMRRALALGKHCFIPVVLGDRLEFHRFLPGRQMRRNRYGIAEPGGRRPQRCPPWLLDLVLMPLVGFDKLGNRLGMGGGYYDRSFAFTRRAGKLPRPALVGLAHHCQQLPRLPANSWDIPLQGVITDQGWVGAKRTAQGRRPAKNLANRLQPSRHKA